MKQLRTYEPPDSAYLAKLGEGSAGAVFRITADLAAKFSTTNGRELLRGEQATEKLEHEFQMCNLAFNGDGSVPQPIGIFQMTPFSRKGIQDNNARPAPVFIMQYVPGMLLREYRGDERYDSFMEDVEQEIQKLRALGIDARDSLNDINVIITKRKKELVPVLVDFHCWQRI